MSAQDTERAAALERRYRRLLRCYPPGHRQVHREEMLGVLLATARPGQRAPGARQTVNLIACGLAIRARRALSSLADETWQDALAVVSLITPALMLVVAALDFALAIREAMVENHAYPAAGPFWQSWLVPFLGGPATAMIGWLAVVLLGLTGRRRAAAAIASIALALALFDLLAVIITERCLVGRASHVPDHGRSRPCLRRQPGGLLACLLRRPPAGPGDRGEAASLPHDRGPFRTLRGACDRSYGEILRAGGSFSVRLLDISVLTIAVAVVVTHVRDTVDRRVAALIAPVLLVGTASIPFEFKGISTATVVLSLASLLFAVLVWPVAIASWRGRVRRSSHALPA